MKLISKFKKKKVEDVVEIPKKEVTLYLLLEAAKGGIVDYLQGNGIMVKSVDTDIDATLKKIIRETNESRLVIVDYGAGGFNDKTTRSDILELTETSSSDGKSVTIFTNNGAIEKEIKTRGITATVRGYRGASDIVKELNTYHEIYNVGGAIDMETENQIEFRGEKVVKTEGIPLKDIDLDIIKEGTVTEEGIESFNVRY